MADPKDSTAQKSATVPPTPSVPEVPPSTSSTPLPPAPATSTQQTPIAPTRPPASASKNPSILKRVLGGGKKGLMGGMGGVMLGGSLAGRTGQAQPREPRYDVFQPDFSGDQSDPYFQKRISTLKQDAQAWVRLSSIHPEINGFATFDEFSQWQQEHPEISLGSWSQRDGYMTYSQYFPQGAESESEAKQQAIEHQQSEIERQKQEEQQHKAEKTHETQQLFYLRNTPFVNRYFLAKDINQDRDFQKIVEDIKKRHNKQNPSDKITASTFIKTREGDLIINPEILDKIPNLQNQTEKIFRERYKRATKMYDRETKKAGHGERAILTNLSLHDPEMKKLEEIAVAAYKKAHAKYEIDIAHGINVKEPDYHEIRKATIGPQLLRFAISNKVRAGVYAKNDGLLRTLLAASNALQSPIPATTLSDEHINLVKTVAAQDEAVKTLRSTLSSLQANDTAGITKIYEEYIQRNPLLAKEFSAVDPGLREAYGIWQAKQEERTRSQNRLTWESDDEIAKRLQENAVARGNTLYQERLTKFTELRNAGYRVPRPEIGDAIRDARDVLDLEFVRKNPARAAQISSQHGWAQKAYDRWRNELRDGPSLSGIPNKPLMTFDPDLNKIHNEIFNQAKDVYNLQLKLRESAKNKGIILELSSWDEIHDAATQKGFLAFVEKDPTRARMYAEKNPFVREALHVWEERQVKKTAPKIEVAPATIEQVPVYEEAPEMVLSTPPPQQQTGPSGVPQRAQGRLKRPSLRRKPPVPPIANAQALEGEAAQIAQQLAKQAIIRAILIGGWPFWLVALVIVMLVAAFLIINQSSTNQQNKNNFILNLEKRGPPTSETGKDIAYTINVTATGNAQDIVVIDTIPENTTFVSAIPEPKKLDANGKETTDLTAVKKVTWSLHDIQSGTTQSGAQTSTTGNKVDVSKYWGAPYNLPPANGPATTDYTDEQMKNANTLGAAIAANQAYLLTKFDAAHVDPFLGVMWTMAIEGSGADPYFWNCNEGKDGGSKGKEHISDGCVGWYNSGNWQVGYGIQVAQAGSHLAEDFKNAYGITDAAKVQEVGNRVIQGGGITNPTTMPAKSVEQLVEEAGTPGTIFNKRPTTPEEAAAQQAIAILLMDPRIGSIAIATEVANDIGSDWAGNMRGWKQDYYINGLNPDNPIFSNNIVKLAEKYTGTAVGGSGSFTSQTLTLIIHPTVDKIYIINKAEADAVGVTGGSGGTTSNPPSGTNTPPNEYTCGGAYTLVGGQHNGKNFGDPTCDLAKTSILTAPLHLNVHGAGAIDLYPKQAMVDEIKKNDPNYERWVSISYCESGFDPNNWTSHEQYGTPDVCGAWGLFQVGSNEQPEGNCSEPYKIPGKGVNGEFDRGDVNWRTQVYNATSYGKLLDQQDIPLGKYWECAQGI